jgi:penicillin-binding protein 2
MKEVHALDGSIILQQTPSVYMKIELDSTMIWTLRKALYEVMTAGGTGGRAYVPGIPVGGKTGSAENSQGSKTHALFMACAPVDNPVIAVSTVLENAGHGGSVAAPVAGAVLRYYFANDTEGRAIVRTIALAAQAGKQEFPANR